jgi:diguanylate cyclase (GGDEF)-like protein/PAS domain S-box-containing protein
MHDDRAPAERRPDGGPDRAGPPRSLYEALACGVLLLGSDGEVLDLNRSAEALLGLERARLLGQPPRLALVRDNGGPLPPREQPHVRAQREGRAVRGVTCGLPLADGTHRWLQFDAVPLLNSDGRVERLAVSLQDVTARLDAERALQASEARYRGLVENASDVVYMHDLAGNFLTINEAGLRLTGYGLEEMRRLNVAALIAPDYLEPAREVTRRQLRDGSQQTYALEILAKDGRRLALEVSTRILRQKDGRIEVQGIARDIGERRRAEQALRESERRFHAIFDGAAIGIARIDLHGRCLEANPALQQMLGYDGATLAGKSFRELVHAGDRQTAAAHFRELAAGRRERVQAELRALHCDGRTLWLQLTLSLVRGEAAEPLFLIGMVEEIGERKWAEAALAHQALHDALTGLPNRSLLHDRLQQAIHTAQRQRTPLALVFLDLDRFKDVNDTFGHHVGDLLLQQAGARLQGALREADTVARLGGDEFAVVLPGADAAGATTAAHKILEALAAPFSVEERLLDVGVSAGVALFPGHADDADTLMRHADVAMYAAKRAGGGVALYTPRRERHGSGRLALIDDLRRALDGDELLLQFRPLAPLSPPAVAGAGRHPALARAEALLRWQHPRRGLLLAEEFLPVAEQSGLINPLSCWLLAESLRRCAARQHAGSRVGVFVSLSQRALHAVDLPETVVGLLQAQGVPAERLTLEFVVEGAGFERPPATLQQLHDLGIRLCLGGFGAAPLGALRGLPVDEVRLAPGFIHATVADGDLALLRAAVDLAHSLGLGAIAAGVDDRETWERVAAAGCDAATGRQAGRAGSAAVLGGGRQRTAHAS